MQKIADNWGDLISEGQIDQIISDLKDEVSGRGDDSALEMAIDLVEYLMQNYVNKRTKQAKKVKSLGKRLVARFGDAGMKKVVKSYYEEQMDDQVKQALAAALSSLYGGDSETFDEDDEDREDYMGFEEAMSIINRWWRGAMTQLWYDDESGDLLDTRPEGYWENEGEDDAEWIDPGDYGEISYRDQNDLLFGELAVRL